MSMDVVPSYPMNSFQNQVSLRHQNTTGFVQQSDVMDLDGTNLRAQGFLTQLPAAIHLQPGPPDDNNSVHPDIQKKNMSEREGHDHHIEGPMKKKAKQVSAK